MEDLAERRRNDLSRSHSVSSYVPIDPFKPSVAYGRKNLRTPATPRRATIMDDNPELGYNDHTRLPPSFVPVEVSYTPPHTDHIRLPPPHEIASRANSTPLPDLSHHANAHPLPQRTITPWGITGRRSSSPGITDWRSSSPTPMVESTSFGFSDDPLPVIREDKVNVDIWEEYRGPDIMPQHSASEDPRRHGRHNVSRASSYSTQAREKTSQLETQAPQYTTVKSEKDTQHLRYVLNKPEKEPAIESHAASSQQEEIYLSTYLLTFVFDTLPRQIYLHLHLRLPYLYFSRVTRIFEDAEISMPEIKEMARAASTKSQLEDAATFRHVDAFIKNSSPYVDLQRSWGLFIDSLLREWKTLNIISVLLLSTILTILQIPDAAADPVTRYTALLSMICALMSLLYGCVFIIRFGGMRTAHKAAEWAQEAQQSKTSIFWNVWVLLAMPTTWLAWSIILFCVCIMSFVWRTGTTADTNRGPLSPHDARIPRIIISVVFALGIIYFVLITKTLRRYGEVMDRAWRSRIMEWAHEKVTLVEDKLRHYSRSPSPSQTVRNQRLVSSRHSMDSIESEIDITVMPPSRPGSSRHSMDSIESEIDITVMPPSRPGFSSSSSASSQQQYESFIKEPDPPPKLVRQPAPISTPHSISHIISADDESSSTTSTGNDCVAGEDRQITGKKLQGPPQINVTKLFNVSPDAASITPLLAEEILASYLFGKGNSEKLALDVHCESNWNDDGTTKTLNVGRIKNVLQHWNKTFFLERGGQIQLCEELFLGDLPEIDSESVINKCNTGTDTGGGHMVLPRPGTRTAIFHFLWKDELPHDPGRYKLNSWPKDLQRVDILYHLSNVPPDPTVAESGDGQTPRQGKRILLFRASGRFPAT